MLLIESVLHEKFPECHPVKSRFGSRIGISCAPEYLLLLFIVTPNRPLTFNIRRAKLRRMQNSDREKAMHYEGKFSDVQGVSVPRTDISLPSYPHSLSTHSSIANLPTLPSIPQARPQHPPPPYQYPPYPYSIDPPSSPPTVEYRQPNNPSAPPPWDGGFYYKQI